MDRTPETKIYGDPWIPTSLGRARDDDGTTIVFINKKILLKHCMLLYARMS